MAEENKSEMSKEEKIGYHKGAINTLIAERTELLKIVQITESLMQAHAKELENLGVKLPTSQPESQNNQNGKDSQESQ